jgi:hypothetical protein
MSENTIICAMCEKPIKGKAWEIDGLLYCSDCRKKGITDKAENNLIEDEFSNADVNELYPTDSAKLGRIVVSLEQQEKHLQKINQIITFFFIVFIVNLIVSVIFVISTLSRF